MSITVMSLVWKSSLHKGSRLLTLLALADWANDEGESIFPSHNTVAKKIRMGRRQAINILSELEESGVISATRNTGASNRYKINLGMIGCEKITQVGKPAKVSEPVQPSAQGCATRFTGGVQPGSPNPSVSTTDTPLGTGDQIAVPGNANPTQNEPTPVIPISESESGGTDMADATTIAKADAVLLAFASKDKSDRSILRQHMSDNGKALMTEFHAFTGLPWMRTWNSAANEMDGLGVRPEHVKAACVRLKTSGMTVVDLHSVKKTAIAVMADARSGKANGGSNGHANGANGYAASPLPGMAAGERITGYQRASDGSMIPIIQTIRNGGVNGAGSSSIH